jgi:predicted DCC family thiol-disulfide oxidoreductase YuxK
VTFLDFNAPGVLEAFPGVTPEACRRGVQLIAPDGKVIAGAEAIARLLATRPLLSPLAAIYFVPGLRSLWDRAYALVARNRYRILGRVGSAPCESNACLIHRPTSSVQPAPDPSDSHAVR